MPNAAEVYFQAIQRHESDVREIFTFPILNISDELMHKKVDGKSLYDLILISSAVTSIEQTPGTKHSGKWSILTTTEMRAQAEKDVNKAILLKLSKTKVTNNLLCIFFVLVFLNKFSCT